jgi:hypothetical protein
VRTASGAKQRRLVSKEATREESLFSRLTSPRVIAALRTHPILDKFQETNVDTGGILGGEHCNDTCPITVQHGERLLVRLKPAQRSVNLSKTLGESGLTWIPALPKISLLAMVNTIGKDMTLVKIAVGAIMLSSAFCP